MLSNIQRCSKIQLLSNIVNHYQIYCLKWRPTGPHRRRMVSGNSSCWRKCPSGWFRWGVGTDIWRYFYFRIIHCHFACLFFLGWKWANWISGIQIKLLNSGASDVAKCLYKRNNQAAFWCILIILLQQSWIYWESRSEVANPPCSAGFPF